MKARQLNFVKPGVVEIRNIILKDIEPDEVLVKALYCGISPGTERLAFRGEFPDSIMLDQSIKELMKPAVYPFSYGYIFIGEVYEAGDDANSWMLGKRVLIFHPHQDMAVVAVDRLIFLPDEIPAEIGVFIPSCETALTLIQDGAPVMGENVCLYGLGLVGQITARMLSEFPLNNLVLIDPSEYRRNAASDISSAEVLEGHDPGDNREFDLLTELSGNPAALQWAINHCCYTGRILAGSWYGSKDVSLELGSSFHRKRIQLISSQVSTIAPLLRGRWDYSRRMKTALKWLERNYKSSWITHDIPFENASEAYELINNPGGEYLQVILNMK